MSRLAFHNLDNEIDFLPYKGANNLVEYVQRELAHLRSYARDEHDFTVGLVALREILKYDGDIE